MLQITIPDEESWDEQKEQFVVTWKGRSLQLEHSLISISKWESRWCKPFLSKKGLTREETLDYIKLMTVTPNVPPDTYDHLTSKNIEQITQYINAPMVSTLCLLPHLRIKIYTELKFSKIKFSYLKIFYLCNFKMTD